MYLIFFSIIMLAIVCSKSIRKLIPMWIFSTSLAVGVVNVVQAVDYLAYTPNSRSTVAVLNTSTNTVINTISPDILEECSIFGLAISPNNLLYVATEKNKIIVIDLNENRLITTIPLERKLDGKPHFITIHPDGSYIYVAHHSKFSVIDTKNNSIVNTLQGHGLMAIHPDGSRIYTSIYHSVSWRVYDLTNYSLLHPTSMDDAEAIAILPNSDSIVVHPNGLYIYLTDSNSNSISVIDTTNYVSIFSENINDYDGGKILGSIPIAIHPSGSHVFLTDKENYAISIFDTSTNTIIESISLDKQPSSVAIHPDGSRIYVTYFLRKGISIIDIATQTVIDTLPTIGKGGPIVFGTLSRSNVSPPLVAEPTPPISSNVVITEDIQINIPQLVYRTDSGELQFWIKLSFVPTNDGSLLWEVKEYGEYIGNTAINATGVILTQNLRLIIPKLTYQGSSFSGSFSYVPTQDGKIRFKLDGYTALKDILIETNLSRGEKVTVPSSGIEIKSIANSNVSVKVTEATDEEGDNVYQFKIEGGKVEINLPNSELKKSKKRGTRRITRSSYIINEPWLTQDRWFLADLVTGGSIAGKNRLPELAQQAFSIEDAGFYLKNRIASQLLSSCNIDNKSCYEGKEPVLFIHGYTTMSALGGGEGTWKNFPQLLQKLGYTTFEFSWSPAARFEDVANDLGQAVDLIYKITGKKVHIIAHSFGGILARTWLQGIASTSNYSVPSPDGIIASLITLGTPHSSIADNNQCMIGIAFPKGQDLQGLALDVFGFEGCEALTCHEAGESILTLEAFREVFGVGEPGELIAKLADTKTNPLPTIDILVQIGLTTFRGSNNKVDDGDGLITYEGQRFLPNYTVTGNCRGNSGTVAKKSFDMLKNNEPIGNARLTETILGFDANIMPGSENTDTNFGGYRHSIAVNGDDTINIWSSDVPVEPFVECVSTDYCDHHGFNNTVQWLQNHTSGKSINFTVIVKDYNNTEKLLENAVITLFNDDGTKVLLGKTQIDEESYGSLEFKVKFGVGRRITISVEVPGYKTFSKLLTTMGRSVSETVEKENIFDILVYPTELTTVTGVKATVENTNIQLSWDAMGDADHYNVYICSGPCLNGEGKYIISSHQTSTSFTDWKGFNVTKYYYVTAVKTDFKGDRVDESKPSEVVSAIVPPASQPTPLPQIVLDHTSVVMLTSPPLRDSWLLRDSRASGDVGLVNFDLQNIQAKANISRAILELTEVDVVNSCWNAGMEDKLLVIYGIRKTWDADTVTAFSVPLFDFIDDYKGETGVCDTFSFDVTDWLLNNESFYGFAVSGPSNTNADKYICGNNPEQEGCKPPKLRIYYEE